MSDVPTNNSRSCDDSSFFEVLDKIKATASQPPEKFVVRSHKRVQIVSNPESSAWKSINKRDRASTAAVPSQKNEKICIQQEFPLITKRKYF